MMIAIVSLRLTPIFEELAEEYKNRTKLAEMNVLKNPKN